MFRNLKEIYEQELKGAFYNEARMQAVEICRKIKQNFLLEDSQIPSRMRWETISNDEEFLFDISSVSYLEKFENTENGLTAIALLMWLFDLKREELFDAPRVRRSDKFVYVKPEQEEDYRTNSCFIEAVNPSYPITIKDLVVGEIGMLNGERIIAKNEESDFGAAGELTEGMRKVVYEAMLPEGTKETDLIGKEISMDGKTVGKILKATFLAKTEYGLKLGINAEMQKDAFEEISRSSKTIRGATQIKIHADEANNKQEVDQLDRGTTG